MKVLVAVACFLAVSSEGQRYQGPQHYPVITKNGVSLDTPEVQAAKQQHLAALAAASNRNGGGIGGGEERRYENYEIDFQRNEQNHFGVPVITNEGVPLETPEVRAAKAHHFAALNAANRGDFIGQEFGANGVFGFAADIGYDGRAENRYAGPQHIPVITKDGVPLDTPEVQAARAKHFNALAAASYGGQIRGDEWYGNRGEWANNEIFGDVNGRFGGYQNVPVIGANGVPLETPEVQAARERHFDAYRKAAQQGRYQIYTGY